VTNLDEAVALYTQILEVTGVRVSPGRHYFDCEGVILCVYDAVADGDSAPVGPNPAPIYFETTDLDGAYARAKSSRQCKRIDAMATRPWGERSFYVVDPYSNVLCCVDKATRFSGQFYVE